MAWKELAYWKNGAIIGALGGISLGIFDLFLLKTKLFVSNLPISWLITISFPGVFLVGNFKWYNYWWGLWVGVLILAVFYTIVGLLVGLIWGGIKRLREDRRLAQ